jgi:hypothetical protein
MNDKRKTALKWVGGVVGASIAGIALMLSATMLAHPAISSLAGLAVAQTATLWNNVKDANAGDGLSSGILAQGTMVFNGLSFDRVRGDTTFGMDVDVTRISGSITPADAYANPTTANQMWSLMGVFNGTTWDRARGSITNGLLTEKKTVGTTFYANDRANITTSSVNLAFGFTSRKIKVIASPNNTADVCIDWLGGTAVCPAANTAGDDRLKAGTALIIDDYAVTSLSVIAESGTQQVQVTAWN